MEELKRGDKIYLDENNTKESSINEYLECRNGIVEVFEYRDDFGYGLKTRLFVCENTKQEVISIIRQTWSDITKEWNEENMSFDTNSIIFLRALLNHKTGNQLGGKYSLVRDLKY